MMEYEVPFDLYEDWKELMYKKVLYLNIVEELKKRMNKED
jgi:hypothetical protein